MKPIGQRIHVIGNSCSGKSNLAAQLAECLEIPFIELDALNWRPGWVSLSETDPDEFERLVRQATCGDAWIVAGSYSRFARRVFWDRLQTLIWLDLPWPRLIARMLGRSWRRWRSRELLWGTNYDSFWRQLKIWRKEDSLAWWIVTQQSRKRRELLALQADSTWSHIRVIRLKSPAEIRDFIADVERRTGASPVR